MLKPLRCLNGLDKPIAFSSHFASTIIFSEEFMYLAATLTNCLPVKAVCVLGRCQTWPYALGS